MYLELGDSKLETVDGHHGLFCHFGSGLVAIHDTTRSTICSFVPLSTREHRQLMSRIPCSRETTSGPMACRSCHGWGVGASPGICYLSEHNHSLSLTSKSAVSRRSQRRRRLKYSDIFSAVDFSPFAIETSGVCGQHALDLVTEIGRRIAAVTHDPRSTMFLRQRLSVAVQHGNAWCVLRTFTNNVRATSINYLNYIMIFVYQSYKLYFAFCWMRAKFIV